MSINASSQAIMAYPATMYAPPALPDLSQAEERRRLSPAALRAFFNIMKHWQVRDEDARGLLGGISNGKFYNLKDDPKGILDQDSLQRVSYLIGIFKALNILYGQRLADQWIQLQNTNPLFSGRTPLTYMLQRGTPGMEVVRRLLDARRGG